MRESSKLHKKEAKGWLILAGNQSCCLTALANHSLLEVGWELQTWNSQGSISWEKTWIVSGMENPFHQQSRLPLTCPEAKSGCFMTGIGHLAMEISFLVS